jgi:hypothetical protein
MSPIGSFLMFSGGSFETLRNLFGARMKNSDNPPSDGPAASYLPRLERPADLPIRLAGRRRALARRFLALALFHRQGPKTCVGSRTETSLGGIP